MKALINKYTLILLSLLCLIFASCNNLSSANSNDGYGAEDIGYVRLCLGGASRTAYPVIDSDDYVNWKWTIKGLHSTGLLGDETEGEWVTLREFDPNAGTGAAKNRVEGAIGLRSGNWELEVTAERIVPAGDDLKTVTVYAGRSAEFEVQNGDSTTIVPVTLALVTLDTQAYGENAWGNMNLTVEYTSTKVSEIWAGLFEVPSFTEDAELSQVNLSGATTNQSTIYTTLVAVTPEEGAASDKYAVKKLTGKVYSLEEVPAGNYVASFWFFDKDGNALNANGYPEYVHIVSGGSASHSESTVKVASLDDVYSITYYPSPSVSCAGSFTRHSDTIVLPDASDLDTSANIFCGWYESSDYSGEPVLEIPHGTRGNKKFYGKYVNAKESFELPDFSLTYALGRLEVGNTVTISFANQNIPSCTYQWFDGGNVISGSTENTYKLKSTDVGKYLGVKVQKKFVVTDYSETADHVLYHVVGNASDADSSFVTIENPVEKGKISLSGVTLQYGGKVIVGEKPSKSSLIISGKLTDDFGNSISSSSLVCDLEDYAALASSKTLGVTVGVEGYDISAGNSANVYITVQYPKPEEAKLRTVNDALGSGETNLGDGKVAFTLATVAMGLQYSTDGGSSWTEVTSAQFEKPSSLLVRYMSTSDYDGDNAIGAGEEGYIMASDSTTVSITNANVGTYATEHGEAGGGSDTPVVVEEKVELIDGPDINALFLSKFKTVTKFEYTTDSAPSTATKISTSDSTVEVYVWKNNLTLYLTASGYSGLIPLPDDCSMLFKGMSRLTSIDLSHFSMEMESDSDDEHEYNLSEMFSGCSKLKTINFGDNFYSDCVTRMNSMFNGTASLESVDLSKFNTSGVTDMSYMFASSGVLELDLSSFDTSRVQSMASMFSESSLETVDFGSNFDTSSVTDMSYMFAYTFLEELDLSGFDTSSVITMESMFDTMAMLTSLDLSGSFVVGASDPESARNVDTMFCYCENLSKIYVENSDVDWSATIKPDTGENMFEGCESLVGGNGTIYEESNIGATFARADSAGTPGYFTAK